jgi:hypothetical protein
MKKIFTLLAGLFFSAAIFAADHRPMVTISSSRNYKIVVDGRSYFSSSATIRLGNLQGGMHMIRVYEMQRGGFVKQERLISTSSFRLGRKDVDIMVDRFGRVTVFGSYGRNGGFDDRHDRDWDNRYDDRNDHNDRDGHQYDRRDDGRNDKPSQRF